VVRVDQYIYANSLDGAFTNWDDDKLVLHNETIQSLSTANLMAIFTPERAQSFQPIRDLSYAVDFALWGERPFGYHVVNTLLHAVGSCFLFLLLRIVLAQIRPGAPLCWRDRTALFVALMFAVHPVQVESVAWISSCKYIKRVAVEWGSASRRDWNTPDNC